MRFTVLATARSLFFLAGVVACGFDLTGATDGGDGNDLGDKDGAARDAGDAGDTGYTGDARDTGYVVDGYMPAVLGPNLTVAPNRRHLVNRATGAPFFWLGDTAWGLISLSPSDAEWYFQQRSNQGFTVISVGNIYPNYYLENYAGAKPFATGGINEPNEDFFDHLDWLIDTAASHGLYMSIRGLGAATDAAVAAHFPDEPLHLSLDETRTFCEWLGNRWQSKPTLIFSGGQDKLAIRTDLDPDNPPDQRPYWRAQGEGWVRGITGHSPAYHEASPAWDEIMMTWHPSGGVTSSNYFHDDGWVTFNQIQSWSFRHHYEKIEADWDLTPAKPTFFGESVYEHAVSSGVDGTLPRTIRAQAYVSVFAGGFGYTYGSMGVYFFDNYEAKSWKQLVEDNPGGLGLVHLRRLIESRPMLDRGDGRGLVQNPGGPGLDSRVQGSLSATGTYAFVYFPRANLGKTIAIHRISGSTANAWWYNPRDGLTYDGDGTRTTVPFASYPIGGSQTQPFDPPGSGTQEDWVLVLDDASKGFEVPGKAP